MVRPRHDRRFTCSFRATANNRYDLAIKQALSATGSTGFTYPACSAAAYAAGQAYTQGETVSYQGYIWEVCNWNALEATIH